MLKHDSVDQCMHLHVKTTGKEFTTTLKKIIIENTKYFKKVTNVALSFRVSELRH